LDQSIVQPSVKIMTSGAAGHPIQNSRAEAVAAKRLGPREATSRLNLWIDAGILDF
jgi:hypothetical protein